MSRARVLASKSLFILRFVGFLGALVLYKFCMEAPFYAYSYAHGKVFNKGVNLTPKATLVYVHGLRPFLHNTNFTSGAGCTGVKCHYGYRASIRNFAIQLEKHGFECIREPERVMATIWAVEAEVNNGGFDQLFYNSAGDISFYASIALKSIGADSMARIAEEALSIFGSTGAPRDCRERQEILISFGEKYEDKLEALDLEFTEYPDDVQELMEAYVEINF